MAWIGREHNRSLLDAAKAFRMGNAVPDDFDAWSRDVEMITGVPKHG